MSNLLELHKVSVVSSNDILNEISFEVKKGQNCIIFGPENSGLDILFSVIMGFEKNFEGEVIYKGASLRDLDYIDKHNYRKEIGYIHSEYGLISNMTVRQNISLPLEYHSKLSDKEIKQFVDDIIYDLNLDSCKSFRPVDLSNSEALRTAYARAIAMDPEMLLIEHAFEKQSPLNIQTFMASLRSRAKEDDKSTIFITYEPQSFVDLGDVFVMLFNGRVVYKGTKSQYLSTDNPYVVQYKRMASTGPMVLL
jgi:phospholipid/cholesterol/gamma-HCH transport system ATP-binding protein